MNKAVTARNQKVTVVRRRLQGNVFVPIKGENWQTLYLLMPLPGETGLLVVDVPTDLRGRTLGTKQVSAVVYPTTPRMYAIAEKLIEARAYVRKVVEVEDEYFELIGTSQLSCSDTQTIRHLRMQTTPSVVASEGTFAVAPA